MASGVFQKAENAVSTGGGTISAVLNGLIFGLVGAVGALLLISIAAVFYDIPEQVMNVLIIIISVVTLFLAGFIAAGKNGKNGLIVGILTGLLYTLIALIVGIIAYRTVSFTPELIADLAIGAAVGGLGGVAGINKAAGKKRRRK